MFDAHRSPAMHTRRNETSSFLSSQSRNNSFRAMHYSLVIGDLSSTRVEMYTHSYYSYTLPQRTFGWQTRQAISQ